MKKLVVAFLFALLCSTFLVPIVSAHPTKQQAGCDIAGYVMNSAGYCVPDPNYRSPCEQPGYVRNSDGVCVPGSSLQEQDQGSGRGGTIGSCDDPSHILCNQTGNQTTTNPTFYCLGGDKCRPCFKGCKETSTGRGTLSDDAVAEEILSCAQDVVAEVLDALSGGAPGGEILVHGVNYAYKVTNYVAIRARHAILIAKLWNTSNPNQQADIAVSILWNELQVIPGIGCAPLLQRLLNATVGQIGVKIGNWIRNHWLHRP